MSKNAEYQPGNQLIVFLRHNQNYLIIDKVSEKTFIQLQKDPSHEALKGILDTHFSRLANAF